MVRRKIDFKILTPTQILFYKFDKTSETKLNYNFKHISQIITYKAIGCCVILQDWEGGHNTTSHVYLFFFGWYQLYSKI